MERGKEGGVHTYQGLYIENLTERYQYLRAERDISRECEIKILINLYRKTVLKLTSCCCNDVCEGSCIAKISDLDNSTVTAYQYIIRL